MAGPEDEVQVFYTALGRFMNEFALAERDLNGIVSDLVALDLLQLSPERQEVLSAVMGSERVKPLTDTIKRIARVMRASDYAMGELDRVLAHLNEIRVVRDRIAHYGAEWDYTEPGRYWVAVQIGAREMNRIEFLSFEPPMLDNMSEDLPWIVYCVRMALVRDDRRDEIARDHAKMAPTKEEAAHYRKPASRPWRYKSGQLRSRGPKHQPDLRRKYAQPPPSRR